MGIIVTPPVILPPTYFPIGSTPDLITRKYLSTTLIATSGTITYGIATTNTGEDASSNTWVVDQIPAGTALIGLYLTGSSGASSLLSGSFSTRNCQYCIPYFSSSTTAPVISPLSPRSAATLSGIGLQPGTYS